MLSAMSVAAAASPRLSRPWLTTVSSRLKERSADLETCKVGEAAMACGGASLVDLSAGISYRILSLDEIKFEQLTT